MKILIVIVLCITGFLFYLWRKQENEFKEQSLAFITVHLPNIHLAVSRFFSNQKNFEGGYFTNQELKRWKGSFAEMYETIKDLQYNSIGLDAIDNAAIDLFLDYFKNGSTYRKDYNREFIKHDIQKYSSFFDNVERRKLDFQQRTAIVTDEDNNIIIAGAGSGKTTTIVGKVEYVIDRYKVPVDQILLISFTNKSAATLASRINIPGIEAKTFHRFGKDVIVATEQKQPSLFDENQFRPLIRGLFKEQLLHPEYLDKVTSYFVNYLKPIKFQDEFKDQGEYIQYLKDLNFSTYKEKQIQLKSRTTIKREIVKSIEECNIANFLLFNNVDYEYEFPYVHETATPDRRQYKPDFTIKQNDITVYLEHFGINKEGMVPHFFANKDKGQSIWQATLEYNRGIHWKRELHKEYGTTLIETYSHEMFDEVLFDNLTKKLLDAGVQLKPKSPEEIWKIISEGADEEIDSFLRVLQTFITLMKSNNNSIAEVREKNRQFNSNYYQKRTSLFLDIIAPVYEKYQNFLADRKEIDFSDMINKATHYISTEKYKRKFKYIIVDEFQDISIGRYQLIKAVKDINPSCKLFCVGDDWQSIYRFSGSDISLFNDFEKYFGFTERVKIETTYRFSDPLIRVSSNFILKNPSQTRKQLKGINNHKVSTCKIVYSENDDDTSELCRIFKELIISGKAKDKEVLILGRYSFDIDRVKNEEGILKMDRNNEMISYEMKMNDGTVHRLSSHFMTVHKSKGLEADIIIVLNCNSGKHGFPSGMSDDNVLNLLLSDGDQYENGEERRLFYVAMTRAKEMVYFIADKYLKSKFIIELEGKDTSSSSKKCPKCITADLVKKEGVKNGKEWAFYGCSNYLYGCDYRKWV